MRLLRYTFLLVVLCGLTLALAEGSRPAAPMAVVPTQYGTNTPTGFGASLYPAQTLLIAGHGAGGPGIGLLVGLSVAGLVVLGGIAAVVVVFLRRG